MKKTKNWEKTMKKTKNCKKNYEKKLKSMKKTVFVAKCS